MVDPDVMNQYTQGMAERGEILNPKHSDMNDMSAYDEFVPPDTLQLSSRDGESPIPDQSKFTALPSYEENDFSNEPNFQQPNIPHFDDIPHEDSFVTQGGPLSSDLESWKKQYAMEGLDIWLVDDLPGSSIYVYRDINRYEYKAISATPNTDPLMREEMICQQCVLFPYDFSYEVMSSSKAGVVSTLAQHILETSCFTRASLPRKL